MRAILAVCSLLAVVACTDTSGSVSAPVGGPQLAETVEVTLDSVLYAVSYAPAGIGGPTVTVARTGGAFLQGDKDKALTVAQKYCVGTGRAPVGDSAMSAARVEGKWEFTNLCR